MASSTGALTHVLQLLVAAVVGDLLAQVDQHVVARVVGRPQELLHLPPSLLVPHLLVLQDSEHLVGRAAQDVSWLDAAGGQTSVSNG